MPTKKLPRNKSKHILTFKKFFPKNVVAFTNDRLVDFKLKPNQTELTARQKIFLQTAINAPIKHFPIVHQVHGKRILIVKRKSCLTSFLGKADGAITARENIPLSVRTADCLSIFIHDPKHKAIGLIHAGWKGSQKRIVVGAVRQMKKIFKTKPKDLRVVFGPAIRSCCYEVKREFQKYFPKEVARRANRFYLDLPFVNRRQLIEMGVSAKHIHDCNICTCCDRQFFSYRREGRKAGRMISLLMLK